MNDDGIYLGATRHGVARASSQRSVLALGPSRSGKTSSLIIPNLLTTSRSVIATSTKDDVVRALASSRRDCATLMFDPSGVVDTPAGVRRVGYSPIASSHTWDGAVLSARSLVSSTRRIMDERGDDHWTERANALVAPLLHAAALDDRSIGEVASAVDRRDAARPLALLTERYGEHHPSVSLLTGILATDERERSGIWSTASGLFSGMRTEGARRASREAPLDIPAFLDGGHQLHIVSPSRHQNVTTPLVVGLIEEIVETTYQRHTQGAQVLLALDEMANVAPLPRLASIVSEGGGQGVVTLACLQDLSQARTRWGAGADGFLSLFPTTVVFPGIADRRTLELLATLGGDVHVSNVTDQRDARGRRQGMSSTWREQPRTTESDIARGRPGFAIGLDENKTLRWISLTPAHADPRFRTYQDRSREVLSRARTGTSRDR